MMKDNIGYIDDLRNKKKKTSERDAHNVQYTQCNKIFFLFPTIIANYNRDLQKLCLKFKKKSAHDIH